MIYCFAYLQIEASERRNIEREVPLFVYLKQHASFGYSRAGIDLLFQEHGMDIIEVSVELYVISETFVQDVKFRTIQNGSLNFGQETALSYLHKDCVQDVKFMTLQNGSLYFGKEMALIIYTRIVFLLSIFNDKHRLS